MSKRRAEERYNLALGQDLSIACNAEDIAAHTGNTQQYLSDLGLEKQDLKILERHGKAIRGRLPTARGHVLRWVLIRGIK